MIFFGAIGEYFEIIHTKDQLSIELDNWASEEFFYLLWVKKDGASLTVNSIDYDKEDIVGYVIPYHAHNDHLQLLAEIGLFGYLFYLLIFILS